MAFKFDPNKVHKLENPARYALLPPERTLRGLGLRRGDTFADIGAGAGFFSIPGAALVGKEGRVIALDVEEDMLDYLRSKSPPSWLKLVLCEDGNLPLADNEADFSLSSLVLHETERPVDFIREMGRITKPRRPVVIIDWDKKDEPEGPPMQHRIHHQQAEDLVKRAGLFLQKMEFPNSSHYMLTCWKKR